MNYQKSEWNCPQGYCDTHKICEAKKEICDIYLNHLKKKKIFSIPKGWKLSGSRADRIEDII